MPPSVLHLAAALAAAVAATPALAVDISAEAGFVSDYRYRGVSLSAGRPAAQGSITLEHGSGAYAEVWASSVDEDDAGSAVEVDLTGGYVMELTETVGLDLAVSFFTYPGASSGNYWEATASLEATKGPVTASLGVSYAPPQRGTRDEWGRGEDNFYGFASAEVALAHLPLTLRCGLGLESGAFDERERGPKLDWRLGAEAVFGKARLGVDYIMSNAGDDGLVASAALTF